MGSSAVYSLPRILLLLSIFFTTALSLQEDRSTPIDYRLPVVLRHSVRHARRQAAQGECPSSAFSPCGQGLPNNFCCLREEKCRSTAANTTAICCPPGGGSCNSIKITTCDIQQLNVTAHPTSAILTLALTSRLPRCGRECCPFGYSCVAGGCVLNADQTFFSTEASPSQPATPAETSPAPQARSDDDPASRSGVIAGSTVAALFVIVVVSALGWSQRRRISKLSRRHHRPAISWPGGKTSRRPPPPPSPTLLAPPRRPPLVPGRDSRSEWKNLHPPLRTCTPPPMELPATPLSFNFWATKRYVRVARPKPVVSPPLTSRATTFPDLV